MSVPHSGCTLTLLQAMGDPEDDEEEEEEKKPEEDEEADENDGEEQEVPWQVAGPA